MAAALLLNPIGKDHDKITDGSCLCGSVEYKITGSPSSRVLCHCISCKKASGSLFQANGFYESSQLQIDDSSLTLKWYTDLSPDAGCIVERSFCSNCGSPLFTRNPKYKDAVIVLIGTMDYENGIRGWKPESEFFIKRRAEWVEGGAETERRFVGME